MSSMYQEQQMFDSLLMSARFPIRLYPNLRLLLLLSWCVLPALVSLSLPGATRSALAGQKKAAGAAQQRAGVEQRLLLFSISEKRGSITIPHGKKKKKWLHPPTADLSSALHYSVMAPAFWEKKVFVRGTMNDQLSHNVWRHHHGWWFRWWCL